MIQVGITLTYMKGMCVSKDFYSFISYVSTNWDEIYNSDSNTQNVFYQRSLPFRLLFVCIGPMILLTHTNFILHNCYSGKVTSLR